MPDEHRLRAAAEIAFGEHTLTVATREYVATHRATLAVEGPERALQAMALDKGATLSKDKLTDYGSKMFSCDVDNGSPTLINADQRARKSSIDSLLGAYGELIENNAIPASYQIVKDKTADEVKSSMTLRAIYDTNLTVPMTDAEWNSKASALTSSALNNQLIRQSVREKLHAQISIAKPDYGSLQAAISEKVTANAEVTSASNRVNSLENALQEYKSSYDASGKLETASGVLAIQNESAGENEILLKSQKEAIDTEISRLNDLFNNPPIIIPQISIDASGATLKAKNFANLKDLSNNLLNLKLKSANLDVQIARLNAHVERTSLISSTSGAQKLEADLVAAKKEKQEAEEKLKAAEARVKVAHDKVVADEKAIEKRLNEIAYEAVIDELKVQADRLVEVIKTTDESKEAREKVEEESIRQKIMVAIRQNHYMRKNGSYDTKKLKKSVTAMLAKPVGSSIEDHELSLLGIDASGTIIGTSIKSAIYDGIHPKIGTHTLSTSEAAALMRITTDAAKRKDLCEQVAKDRLALTALKDDRWLKGRFTADDLLTRSVAGDIMTELVGTALTDEKLKKELETKFPALKGGDKSKIREFMSENRETMLVLLLLALGLPLAAAFL